MLEAPLPPKTVKHPMLALGCRNRPVIRIALPEPLPGLSFEFVVVGYLLDSGNRSGIGLVGRSPWTWGPLWGRRPVRLLAGPARGPAAGAGARPTSLHRTRAS